MEWNILILGFLGLTGLYLVGQVVYRPLWAFLRLVISLAIGGLLLVLTNVVLSKFDLHVAVNVVTLLIAGFLQIPGIILLVLLNFLY